MWAAPPQCKKGTLASYISLGANGCTFANVTYANFKYSASAQGGASIIQANQITVLPTLVVPATGRFKFSAPWSVGTAQSQGSKITYTTVLPCGDTAPAELDLVLGTAELGGIGSVTVNETTNVGKLSVFETCNEITCQPQPQASLQFAPPTGKVVLITNDVSLAGQLGGASLNEFDSAVNWCRVCPVL
jgi:hypothetical protein